MATHTISIHIHRKRYARDGAEELTPMQDLVARLFAAIKARKTHATNDEDDGHEFHGNQYTQVAGQAKPTSTKATSSKAGVHELLSTGHHFSLEELMAATGVNNKATIMTALSDLKNPKYAGKLGALQIAKHKDGSYHVVKGDGVTPAVEPPKIDPPKAEHATPIPTKTKAEADATYTKTMEGVAAASGAALAGGVFTPEVAAKHWKTAKAHAMAQWASDTTGKPATPAKVEVFAEDIALMHDLAAAVGDKDAAAAAMSKWKAATAAAKAAPKHPPPLKKTTPESHKPGPVATTHETPENMKVPEAKGTHLQAPTSIRPKGHVGVAAADFETPSTHHTPPFATHMGNLDSALHGGHDDAKANKAAVVAKLQKRLKDSPHFQHWAKLYKPNEIHKTLESRLIASWASSSGDHHALSVAMQHATQQAFGMDKSQVEWAALAGGASQSHLAATEDGLKAADSLGTQNPTPQQVESFHTALKDFVLAQYHETQDHLKSLGVTEVCVARGMSGHAGTTGDHVKLRLQPASSFSTDLNTARFFSEGHSVYFSKVPASQVLSSFRTGYGCTGEHEVVVLSHPDTTAAVLSTTAATGPLTTVCNKIGSTTKWHETK